MRGKKGFAAHKGVICLLAVCLAFSACAHAARVPEEAAPMPSGTPALPFAPMTSAPRLPVRMMPEDFLDAQAVLARLSDMEETERHEWIADAARMLSSPYREGLLMGETYVHHKGFAFDMPEGFTLREEYEGAAVMLLGSADWRDFQPSISMKLLDWDEELLSMGREQMEELYRRSITQYQPGTFDYIALHGMEILALSYTQGRGEKALYFQQALFNAVPGCFIITMSTTEADAEAAEAVFAEFITSLRFISENVPVPPDLTRDTPKGKD